ncbi:MAG: branched-chain amino acid aminotransferase [Ichthyobacteriaceae bacterium]|nr:branched-chain amino acid aminotransferase [Ichthyobacteriaceae bacterium]
MQIIKAEKSRLSEVDFNNLEFGANFTDHMFIADFKNGEWNNSRIVPYAPLVMSPGAKVLHYGQSVFEGMKAYKDSKNQAWLFRPEENQKRLNLSAERLDMPALPADIFNSGLEELLKLDSEWIPTQEGKALYIRPFIFASEETIVASSSTEYKFMILMSPVGQYFTQDVKLKIADKFSRAANGGVGFAKAAGNYASSFYPARLAKEEGFDQVIWTDDATHTLIEEAGVMNVFFRIGDKLITAPTSERILDGITRKSIIDVAKNMGIDVEVRTITVKEVVESGKDGSLKEAFGCGTAAIISPIYAIGYQQEIVEMSQKENRWSEKLKTELFNIQTKKGEDKFGWTKQVTVN